MRGGRRDLHARVDQGQRELVSCHTQVFTMLRPLTPGPSSVSRRTRGELSEPTYFLDLICPLPLVGEGPGGEGVG
jgi:hypothetical protein